MNKMNKVCIANIHSFEIVVSTSLIKKNTVDGF